MQEDGNTVLKGVKVVFLSPSMGTGGKTSVSVSTFDILAGGSASSVLDVYEASVSDYSFNGPGASFSNPLQDVSLTKENTLLRLNVTSNHGIMVENLYVADFNIGANKLPHYHVTVLVNNGTWTTSNGENTAFKFKFPRVARGDTSSGPLTVTATEPTSVTSTNQLQQATTYRYVNMKMPRTNNAFTVDLYQMDTNSTGYVGIVNPLTTYGLWVTVS